MKFKIGDQAPVFKGIDQNDLVFDSRELLGKKNLVVYFYPKNETRVCTAQACSFRDHYEDFLVHNCEVVGISRDSGKSHESFKKNHNLPFTLITDKDRALEKLFDVPRSFLGLLPGRYTFVIDKEGQFLEIFEDKFNAKTHIDAALNALTKPNS